MLICNSKNSKFSNLTVGKDYEGTINGDFAEVTNDAGVVAKYHRKYFTETASAPAVRPVRERPAPPPAPAVRELSLTDIINRIHITSNIEEDNYIINIEYRSTDRNINDSEVAIYPMEISCGIAQFNGLNSVDSLANRICNTIEASVFERTSVSQSELFMSVIVTILREYKSRSDKPFLVLSPNNPGRASFTHFREFLRTNGVMTENKTNPSSNNPIAVWVVDLTLV